MILPILFVFITYSMQLGAFEDEVEDVDSAISDVFGIGKEQDDQNLVSCECVPFYLCKNNTINDNGEGVIDIRGGFGDTPGTPSKCPHYMDRCCGSGDRVPPPPPPKVRVHTCGNRHPDGVGFRITGDEDNEANYGEFPWMVAVLRHEHVSGDVNLKVMTCGGSLIHPQVVLTAAHCVRGKKNLLIRAGEWDTQTDKEMYPSEEREVKEIIVHEKYYPGGLFNDVALLILDGPLELSEIVDTVCLPGVEEDMNGRRCFVSGWGKDSFGKEGKYQLILKKVEQPTIAHAPCQEALRKTRLGARFKLHQSFLCAGGELGKDACKGDGGGPLVCPSYNNPNVYVQAGIVAWGIGCGGEVPAVYGNVPHFRQWIDEKMALHNLQI